MKKFDKLVFVDKSDTSVAPMAEAVMQELLLLEDILIESKGMVVLFPEPVSERAVAALERHDLHMTQHSSSQFTAEDFDERTLVLTMEESQKRKLLEDHPGAVNLYSLGEYVNAREDVTDPYGGDQDDYEACYDRLRGLLLSLAEKLKEEDI